jgi:hypothetical protein
MTKREGPEEELGAAAAMSFGSARLETAAPAGVGRFLREAVFALVGGPAIWLALGGLAFLVFELLQ